jgi:hypothetical protein
MECDMSDAVELLRGVYPDLTDEQKGKVARVVEIVKEAQARTESLRDANLELKNALDSAFPEAPASATVKVVEKSTQLEWLVTARVSTAALMLIDELPGIGGRLLENGFIALDAYIDQRRAERQQDQAPPPVAPAAVGGNGDSGRLCSTHGTPMRPSKHGSGFYCPQVVAPDDGTGKPVYCKQK